MWRERRLPTHGATRASHFEFQQAFCSGRGAGGGGGCGYGCPRLIFQMSKDRGHEAILLILDVAAVSPLGGRSTSFLFFPSIFSSFSFFYSVSTLRFFFLFFFCGSLVFVLDFRSLRFFLTFRSFSLKWD